MSGNVFRLAMASAAVLSAALQATAQAPPPIQDNSFLIEEAYNQEDGVIQHVSFFTRTLDGGWAYSFTEEWPVRGQRHQLSVTLPLVSGPPAGVGDLALNYRLQLLGSGEARLAFAPRVSLLLPSGGDARGAGRAGVQVNLPLSLAHSSRLVTHWNAGVTLVPGTATRRAQDAWSLGQSVVVQVRPRFNVLLETAWTRTQRPDGGHDTSLLLAPGLRRAYDLPGGLQIVPGLAWAFGVGPSAGQRTLLVYLSFEHPLAAAARHKP